MFNFPVHALGETYSLTTSAARLQESNTARVLLILNVSNANTVANYAFTWSVRDPAGSVYQASNQTNAPHVASFVESAAYPGKFGASASLAYTGVYAVWVNQTQPPLMGSTGVGTPVQFQVGLTDSLSYQRLLSVSIKAVNYAPGLNVTIKISGLGGAVTGFPLNRTADNAGVLSYTWLSIPASLAVGDYTLILAGSPVKNPPDIQSFSVMATNVTISSLSISRSILQMSQTEDFHFSAYYLNGLAVKTGFVNLHLVEADGSTHYVAMTYSATLNAFHGTFQFPLSSQVGPWAATVEANSFDDGYGNKGPVSSVLKLFTVSSATLTVSATTDYNNYTVGGIVVIYASVVTPGGYNFTSGTVTATTYHSSSRIGSPLSLFYDQSRGKWVGSYTVNSTNPAGIWQIQVNASDIYGNMGQGSTSTLVNVPTVPQQNSTLNYLLVAAIVLVGGLAILVSWILYGRKRVLRKVLKVDIEAIHAEAKKVENQDFFKKVQEQLKQQREESGKGNRSG